MLHQQRTSDAELAPATGDPGDRALPPLGVHRVVLALALAATLLAYYRSAAYQFVYDDHAIIQSNTFIRSWSFASHYFSQHMWEAVMPGTVSNYYRPVFIFWLRLNHMLFGLRPWGWHLASILVHLGVTFLVYLTVAKLTRDQLTGAFASMIYGLHPAHVEAVVWMSGATESVAAFFFLLSFVSYLGSRDGSGKWRSWRILSLMWCTVAMFAKETGLILPLLVFVYEWLLWESGPGPNGGVGRTMRLKGAARRALPFLAVLPVYLVPRALVLKGLSHVVSPLPATTVFLTLPSLLWFYLKRLVWPVGMSPSYDLPYVRIPGFTAFFLPLGAIVGVLLLSCALERRSTNEIASARPGKKRIVAFGAAWFFLLIFPVLNASFLSADDFAHDRHLYLPSVGFAMVAALALRSVKLGKASIFGQPAAQFVTLGLLMTALFWGTAREENVWSNDVTLYSRGLSAFPDSGMLKRHLAVALFDEGHYAGAAKIFQDELARGRGQWEANYNLGRIYYRIGRLDKAHSCLRQAITIMPIEPTQYVYLGLIELQWGRLDEAARAMRDAVRANPNAAGVHFALGMVLKLQGNLNGALEEFRRELDLSPEESRAREQIVEIEARLRGLKG